MTGTAETVEDESKKVLCLGSTRVIYLLVFNAQPAGAVILRRQFQTGQESGLNFPE